MDRESARRCSGSDVRRGVSTLRENAEAPHFIFVFSVLIHPAPKKSPGSRARAGRSIKLSGREQVREVSFPRRWGQTPGALFSLPQHLAPDRHSCGKSVAREPEKGRPREPASTGGSVGRRSSGK